MAQGKVGKLGMELGEGCVRNTNSGEKSQFKSWLGHFLVISICSSVTSLCLCFLVHSIVTKGP